MSEANEIDVMVDDAIEVVTGSDPVEVQRARDTLAVMVPAFGNWLLADKETVELEAAAFRRALAIVITAEAEATVKRDENPQYSAALAALNAEYPWLDEYHAKLSALRESFGSGLSDLLDEYKRKYNTFCATLRQECWGSKNLPTVTAAGKERKPNSK